MKKIYIFLSIIILFIFLVSINKTEAFTCGEEFADTRDGKSYSTVLIGEQCWFSENLNYDNGCMDVEFIAGSTLDWCGCYNNDPANCSTYGLLYQWNTAMDGSTAEGVQGVCPAGWHIPTHDEFTTLERGVCSADEATCATRFPYNTSTTGWRGVDEGTKLKIGGSSGFNILLAGYRYASGGGFAGLGSTAALLSSTISGDLWNMWHREYGSGALSSRNVYGLSASYSVRCLKNETPIPSSNLIIDTNSITTNSIEIQWTDNSEDETGFVIELSTNGTDYTVVETVSANTTSYTIENLDSNTEYWFRVAATNEHGNSDYLISSSVRTNAIPKKSGSTVQSRVSNLIAMGNNQLAEELMRQYPSQFTNQNIQVNQGSTIQPTTPKYTFTKLLKYTLRDNEVKELQKYLNNNGYPLTLTGLGSKNNETDYFGPLTLKAVKLFQQANNLVPDGIVGPLTRGVLNK